MSRLSREECDRRIEKLHEMRNLGADVGIMLDGSNIENQLEWDDFVYQAQRASLVRAGMDMNQYPVQTSDLDVRARQRMGQLWDAIFMPKTSKDEIFAGCYDVREKIARLGSLTEGELFGIQNDLTVEHVVRKYAEGILYGDISDLHKILDQALGKPVERVMTINQQVSPIEKLGEAEIRKLLEAQDELEVESDDRDIS